MNSIINKDYYRCMTFQPKDVIDRLLKNGFVERYYYDHAKREDKTNFYEQYLTLKEDVIPMYAWAGLWYCGGVVAPIDVQTLGSSWSYHMGFMSMHKCSIIEFDLPKSECVLGKHGSLNLCDFDKSLDDSIEAVFSHIKLEWVSGIYSPVSNSGTYSNTTYTPIYVTDKNMMIDRPIVFEGSGYPTIEGKILNMIESHDYYASYGWKYPVSHLTILELSRLMNRESFISFIKFNYNLDIDSADFNDRWESLRNELYIKDGRMEIF